MKADGCLSCCVEVIGLAKERVAGKLAKEKKKSSQERKRGGKGLLSC